MDGVLVEYRRDVSPENIEEKLKQPGYFLNLRPEWNMIGAMRKLYNLYPDRVFILTAVYGNQYPYSIPEKIEYTNKVFPFMNNNLIIVDGDKGETKPSKIEKVLGKKIDSTFFLIDDYGKNLKLWNEQGGSAVKYLNLVNNNHGTVYERTLNCFMSEDEIFAQLIKY